MEGRSWTSVELRPGSGAHPVRTTDPRAGVQILLGAPPQFSCRTRDFALAASPAGCTPGGLVQPLVQPFAPEASCPPETVSGPAAPRHRRPPCHRPAPDTLAAPRWRAGGLLSLEARRGRSRQRRSWRPAFRAAIWPSLCPRGTLLSGWVVDDWASGLDEGVHVPADEPVPPPVGDGVLRLHTERVDRPLVVDEQTAAALLACSRRTIRRLAQRGSLPRVFITRRSAYRLSDLEAIVAQASCTPVADPPHRPSSARFALPAIPLRHDQASAGALPSTWPQRRSTSGRANGDAPPSSVRRTH